MKTSHKLIMMMSGAAPELDPTTMGTLLCWVEARKLVGLNNGDVVGSFTDFSGAGNHLTSTTTGRPAYTLNQINGLPAVVYTTAAEQWSGKAFTANQPLTRIIVARLDTFVTGKYFWSGGGNPNECGFYANGTSGVRVNAGTAVDKAVNVVNGDWFMCSVVYNGASSIFRWNGTQSTASPGTAAGTGATLGNSAYHTGGLAMAVAAYLQYDGDISSNLPTIETWLKGVYNLPF
jgi:hypothetical protein